MELYAENILDHFKNPRNFGTLKDANLKAKDVNLICGDKITVQLKVDKKGKIQDIKFCGSGCAISQASASMLTEVVKGKTIEQAKKINNDDIYKMLAVPLSASRVKCALLGLFTLKKALEKKPAKEPSPNKPAKYIS